MKRSVLWGWVPREVMTELGVSRKRYELVRARALVKVARRLEETGSELWERGKARLIAALVAGTASAAQVKRARALAEQSPDFRFALARYEATLHSVTVAIPAEAALRDAHRAALTEWAIAVVDRGREAAAGVLSGRGPNPVDGAVSSQVSSAAARGAGAAGGGGVLAKLGGSGFGAKIIAACLTGAAAAGGCIAAGVVPDAGLPHPGGSATKHQDVARTLHRESASVTSPRPGPAEASPDPTPPAPPPLPAQTTTPEPPPTTTTTSAAPSPVGTEFGVEPSASSSPTSSSAPASGGGGGGSTTAREFGP